MDESKKSVEQGVKLCSSCGEVLQPAVEFVALRGAYAGAQNYLEMDVYFCPNCDKLEFYRIHPALVTCPICGTQHSKHISCPNCMMDGGLSQLGRNIGQQKKHEKQEKERKTKAPWDWKK